MLIPDIKMDDKTTGEANQGQKPKTTRVTDVQQTKIPDGDTTPSSQEQMEAGQKVLHNSVELIKINADLGKETIGGEGKTMEIEGKEVHEDVEPARIHEHQYPLPLTPGKGTHTPYTPFPPATGLQDIGKFGTDLENRQEEQPLGNYGRVIPSITGSPPAEQGQPTELEKDGRGTSQSSLAEGKANFKYCAENTDSDYVDAIAQGPNRATVLNMVPPRRLHDLDHDSPPPPSNTFDTPECPFSLKNASSANLWTKFVSRQEIARRVISLNVRKNGNMEKLEMVKQYKEYFAKEQRCVQLTSRTISDDILKIKNEFENFEEENKRFLKASEDEEFLKETLQQLLNLKLMKADCPFCGDGHPHSHHKKCYLDQNNLRKVLGNLNLFTGPLLPRQIETILNPLNDAAFFDFVNTYQFGKNEEKLDHDVFKYKSHLPLTENRLKFFDRTNPTNNYESTYIW